MDSHLQSRLAALARSARNLYENHETTETCKRDVTMKTIGSDNTYIDYWQDVAPPLLKTPFGIRVREGRFSAIIKVGAEQPKVVSESYPIPIKPGTLPTLI